MILFEITSRLGTRIRTTRSYWKTVATKKHPTVANRIADVKLTLTNPDEFRRSRYNSRIYLYYRKLDDRFICVVAKHLNEEGFIVTAYLTHRIKRGELAWRKP